MAGRKDSPRQNRLSNLHPHFQHSSTFKFRRSRWELASYPSTRAFLLLTTNIPPLPLPSTIFLPLFRGVLLDGRLLISTTTTILIVVLLAGGKKRNLYPFLLTKHTLRSDNLVFNYPQTQSVPHNNDQALNSHESAARTHRRNRFKENGIHQLLQRRGTHPRLLARNRRLPHIRQTLRRPKTLHLLRWAPLRHGTAPLRPPPRIHHQRYRPAIRPHERALRRATVRVGYPWTACRA